MGTKKKKRSSMSGMSAHVLSATLGLSSPNIIEPSDTRDVRSDSEELVAPSPERANVPGSLAIELWARLARMGPLERTAVVCEAATSEDADERLAIARVLCSSVEPFCAASIIEALAVDSEPSVRLASGCAAWLRSQRTPLRYEPILARLQGDPHPDVRRFADLALGTRTSG